MEASARGAREADGHTIGVITPVFGRRSANRWIEEVIVEDSLISRMLKLIELGDAYIILKGGTGTLLELAAVWEFINKGLMAERPIVVLGGFWNGVVGTLKEELAWEGRGDCTRYVMGASSVKECIQGLTDVSIDAHRSARPPEASGAQNNP
jgi:hypothetical protein